MITMRPSKLKLIATLVVLTLANGTMAQGTLDPTFGPNGNGISTFTIAANETVVDAHLCPNSGDDFMVMTSSPGDYNTYGVSSNGAADLTAGFFWAAFYERHAHLGGTSAAAALTAEAGSPFWYSVGQGSNSNVCTVVGFEFLTMLGGQFTGGGSQVPGTVLNLPLPAPYQQCAINAAQISSGKLYVSGATYNTSSDKLGLTLLRMNSSTSYPLTLAIDPMWTDSNNVPGFVRKEITSPGVNLAGVSALAMDATNLYVVGNVSMPNGSPATVVVGFNKSTGQLASNFGKLNLNLMAGNGVYLIPGFIAADMIESGGNLFINGKIQSGSGDDFGLARLSLPATSAGAATIYPAVDLLGHDRPLRLVSVGNNIISAGRSIIVPPDRSDVSLAQYDASGAGLTNGWTPSNLQVLQVGSSSTNSQVPGDLRRVMPGQTGELIVKGLIVQSDSKLVVIAQRTTLTGKEVWMARFNVN